MWYRRVLAAAALLLVAVAALASTAAAERPYSEPLSGEDITLVGACPFAVLLHPAQLNETFRLYSDGRYAVTGVAKVQVTNLATLKSIVVNASGPGQFRPTADGGQVATIEGLYLNWGFAPDPFLELTAGRVTVVYGADGSIASVTYASRHVRDLCSELTG